MKLKSSMSVVAPILLVMMVISFLVAVFVVDNNHTIPLKYHIPFTSIQFPAPDESNPDKTTVDVHVVYIILFSILIGIVIMMFFVAIAGLGWRYYVLKNKSRERKERKILWDHRERAIALSLMGFHRDAVEQLESIIDKENPHIELYVALAETFERQGDAQKAIENYNTVLARYPENMRALYGAARNWEALGNHKDAIKLYNRVLDIDRSSPTARAKVQELLVKAKEYQDAIAFIQRTRSGHSDPQTQELLASLYYRLAIEQIKANDLRLAERTLKESRREYDYYVPNMLILSNLYLKTDRAREAERLLELTAEQTFSTIIFQKLIDYYQKQPGTPQETLEPVVDLYLEMLRRDPNANHLRLGLAKLYMKLEQFTEAEKMLIAFQSDDPSIPQAHLLLADVYHQTGQIEKALEEYRISSQLVDIKIADFKCSHCGAMYEFWADQCTSCGSWGTIEDIFFKRGPQSVLPQLKAKPVPQLATTSATQENQEMVVSGS
ncbi:tetratricopeptide TPR_2 [Candidatus Moduliflexus flocculans]|uniref:Tetratricopeptide TPR_2 n=1 Tax=Candidatus Moduliflexus flocculans TaxID=1499966 RepID=A0A081BP60_9BACT|nr:tetratricopeptide TPR_2 [Candidatus Moduliflexus flocculans]